MQFIDLHAQFERLKPDIRRRIDAVLAHGQYILGPEVAEFEAALAAYCGTRHSVSCANGTDALVLALRALDVGPGDRVVTSAFSFFASAEAIRLVGADPVFVDIDPATFNMDPDALERLIEGADEPPKAVIPVDLFGLPADYPRIAPICKRHGLPIVEDAAQAFGGAIGPRKAGGFGTIGSLSFFPAKPLGCYGDGGALLTDDDALADRLRSLRFHGRGTDKYDNVAIGLNSRLDTIQAAILLAKLSIFEEELVQRQAVAARYAEALSPVVIAPRVPEGMVSSWAQYTLLASDSEQRDGLRARLDEQGIPSMIYYSRPLHLQPALADLGYGRGALPRRRGRLRPGPQPADEPLSHLRRSGPGDFGGSCRFCSLTRSDRKKSRYQGIASASPLRTLWVGS